MAVFDRNDEGNNAGRVTFASVLAEFAVNLPTASSLQPVLRQKADWLPLDYEGL